jgi:hypothetical protein
MEIKRIEIRGQPWAKTRDPVQKVQQKRVGDVAHMIEFLPSKCEALSSNPNSTKRRASIA